MKTAMTEKELAQFLKNMELGTEQTIMAIDGTENSIMPDLAMGVIKEKYFDSDTSSFLVGVYGSDCDFESFFSGDYDDEDTCIENVINWFIETGNAFCGVNFNGLYIKPTDKEEQAFYEENKYNGEIVRTIPDSFLWGDIDMVARFSGGVVFYDCYQKDGGNYLGEFTPLPMSELDDYDDQQIIDKLEETKYDKIYNNDSDNNYEGNIVRTIDTIDWGEVDLVSRYDEEDNVTYYDCYQKNGGGYLGEFRLEYETTIDDYTDKDIEISISTDMETGW